jgi:hypothetical protein
MEIIYIGGIIFFVWLVRTLHKIMGRDQEETDKKIAFAKWAKEQHDPRLVSMVQNLMTEGRFKTLEEATQYAEQALNTPSVCHRSLHLCHHGRLKLSDPCYNLAILPESRGTLVDGLFAGLSWMEGHVVCVGERLSCDDFLAEPLLFGGKRLHVCTLNLSRSR